IAATTGAQRAIVGLGPCSSLDPQPHPRVRWATTRREAHGFHANGPRASSGYLGGWSGGSRLRLWAILCVRSRNWQPDHEHSSPSPPPISRRAPAASAPPLDPPPHPI